MSDQIWTGPQKEKGRRLIEGVKEDQGLLGAKKQKANQNVQIIQERFALSFVKLTFSE